MAKLSVNVNKIATLRNARGKNLPDLVQAGQTILDLGVHGLTVHPRPDGRHIRKADVFALQQIVLEQRKKTRQPIEFNVEGYPSADFLELLDQVLPHQVTLVPDPPEALTSQAGWEVRRHETWLTEVVLRLKAKGIRVSLFVDPLQLSPEDELALQRIGADRAELYTEAYAECFGKPKMKSLLSEYRNCAQRLRELGLGIHAGHDLNQKNLSQLIQEIPWIQEVSIGHALICEALYEGLSVTIRNYLKILAQN